MRLRVGDAHFGDAVGGARLVRLALVANDIRERAGLVEQKFIAIQVHQRMTFLHMVASADKNLGDVAIKWRSQILGLVAAQNEIALDAVVHAHEKQREHNQREKNRGGLAPGVFRPEPAGKILACVRRPARAKPTVVIF